MTARTWSAEPTLVGVVWVLAAAAAGWLLLTDDPPGKLMAGIAAVLLIVIALFGTIARPRLAADSEGIAIRGLFRSYRWPWAQVTVRLVRSRRLGRDTAALEVEADEDGGEHLIVLTRLDLGADPEDVAEILTALRC